MLARRAIGMATLAVLAIVALGACGGDKKKVEPAKARPGVTIEAVKGFKFSLPEQMPSGWVDVTLRNNTGQIHQLGFVKLGSLSYDDFKKAAASTDLSNLPDDTVFVGGPNNVLPLQSITTTIHLEPGTYGVVCFIPDPKDGKSHASKGMVGKVDVTPSVYTVETPPTADGAKIDLTEFDFLVDSGFKGVGTVSITNVGKQVHELVIYKIADGKTLADVKKFLFVPPGAKPPAGKPPFTAVGGVTGVSPKQTAYAPMILAPGKYALVCFLPDPAKDNQPHALEGMIKEITITS